MEIAVALLLTMLAVGAVLYPLVRGDVGAGMREFEPPPPLDTAALEREVERYRAALRAGTLCRRCGQANLQGSRFCQDCGRRLRPAAAHREQAAPAR